MTQEDKQLLLVDLCARLPYGVKVQYNGSSIRLMQAINIDENEPYFKSKEVAGWLDVKSCKPFLRPMSSMTEEEKKELNNVLEYQYYANDSCMCEASDWLNAHHFDYRNLLTKGLAIEITKENNPYEN